MATLDQLLAAGFEVTGGQIDKGGVNYGRLTADGVELNDAGEELMKSMSRKGKKARDEEIAAVVKSVIDEGSMGA